MNENISFDQSPSLTKKDLVTWIGEHEKIIATGFSPAEIQAVVQLTLDGIIAALGEDKHVEFRDFGVFEKVERKGRIGRNPNKPENEVQIPDRKVIKFKPGKRMREMLANPEPTPL